MPQLNCFDCNKILVGIYQGREEINPKRRCWKCWKIYCDRNFPHLTNKEWRKLYPWKAILSGIKQRCNNPKATKYRNYGGKGIKCLLTEEEIKFLWIRDKAENLKRLSIDRLDPKKNYELSNCRFIELSENSRLGGYSNRLQDEFTSILNEQKRYYLRKKKRLIEPII